MAVPLISLDYVTDTGCSVPFHVAVADLAFTAAASMRTSVDHECLAAVGAIHVLALFVVVGSSAYWHFADFGILVPPPLFCNFLFYCEQFLEFQAH